MPKKSEAQVGEESTKLFAPSGKAKKKIVSRSEKAGLTMSVSKIHTHMMRRKMHKNSGGVTRVSVSAPVWVTAAIEYFAAELLEQAGNATKSVGRKRINIEDVMLALRADNELDKATAGFRVLAGDKLKGELINDELLTKTEKDEKEKARVEAKAKRAAAKAA